jgi:hypothetical protein
LHLRTNGSERYFAACATTHIPQVQLDRVLLCECDHRADELIGSKEVNFEQERNATVLLCLFYEIRKNRKRLPSLPSLAKQTHGCLAATRGPGRRLW